MKDDAVKIVNEDNSINIIKVHGQREGNSGQEPAKACRSWPTNCRC